MGMSPLDQIKARREAISTKLGEKPIAVPLWTDPALYVVVRPLDATEAERLMSGGAKVGRRQKAAAFIRGCAAIIATATVKVLIGEEDSPDGQAEVELPDLRESLGLPEDADSVTTVKAMCFTDGYVIQLANAVLEHSGLAGQQVDADFLGE